MPRTRSLAWTELKLGLIALIAVSLAVFLIFLLGSAGGFFWQRYPLKIVLGNVAGLKPGAPVRLSGVEIGSVESMQFVGEAVEVVIEVSEEQRQRITTNSRATLGSVSLLGEGAVDITAATEGTPIPAWGYIPTGRATASVAEVAEQATAGIEAATGLLNDIRAGRGTVGRMFTDDAVYRDLQALLSASDRVMSQVARGDGTLGRLVNDPTLYKQLTTTVGDLNAITARLRAGEGSLGQLLADPAFAKSVTSTTQNLEKMTAQLNRGDGTMGKLLNDAALYDRLNETVRKLETLTTNLNAGEGTMGQLLKDKQLYENMNQTVIELRDFLAEVKKDPKKYLNVKVSIF